MVRKILALTNSIAGIGLVFITMGMAIIVRANDLFMLNINFTIIQNILLASTLYSIILSITELLDIRYIYEPQCRNLCGIHAEQLESELDLYRAIDNSDELTFNRMHRITNFLKTYALPFSIAMLCVAPIQESTVVIGVSIMAFGLTVFVYGKRNKIDTAKSLAIQVLIKEYYKTQLEKLQKSNENNAQTGE